MTLRRINRGSWHQYVDGDREMPGVTTVLNKALPKPALVQWAANEAADYVVNSWDELSAMAPAARLRAVSSAHRTRTRAAMARGSQIHAYGERLARGYAVDIPDEFVGPVEAYARYLDRWNVSPMWLETTVASRRWGYAGTLDLIATDTTGDLWLGDIKTGKGVYPETALQLAAYRNADVLLDADGNEHPVPQVARCQVMHVLSDAVRVVPVQAGVAEFRAFLHAFEVYRWLNTTSDGYPVGLPVDSPPTLEVAR